MSELMLGQPTHGVMVRGDEHAWSTSTRYIWGNIPGPKSDTVL